MTSWLAGSAISRFPVPEGAVMGGYADRVGGVNGTLDDLEIGVLVLVGADQELHIVTADVVGIDEILVSEIADTSGIPVDNLLVCASHTHSGPLGVPTRLHPASEVTVGPALRKQFVTIASETLSRARTRLELVTLEHGACRVDAVWTNRNNPTWPADDRLRTLVTRRSDGSLQTLLMLVPCHPTLLGAWNRELSADLHGGIRRAVRARLPQRDTGATLLTVTGAAGNVSTRFARRESSPAEVNRLGNLVADQVMPILNGGTPVDGHIRRASHTATLPMRNFDADAAQRELEAAQQALQSITLSSSTSEAARRQAYTRLQGARILAAMGEVPPIPLTLTAWGLGDDFTLVSVPGELFASLGIAIESLVAPARCWVIGYANGYIGYLPDSAAYEHQTYEALSSPYQAHVGDAVLDSARRLLVAIGRNR